MEEDISNKTGDISNKTIVVLVILTVVISVVGTLTVLREVSDTQARFAKAVPTSSSGSGQVTLTIVPDQPVPEPVASAGYVTFNIVPDK
jgi:hypothetical protein